MLTEGYMGETQMAYAALALESKARLDAEIIPQEVVLQSCGRDQAGGNNDDDFICDEGDESMDEQSDEEEAMISTDTDIDPDIEP